VCRAACRCGPRSLGPLTPQWPVRRFWRELWKPFSWADLKHGYSVLRYPAQGPYMKCEGVLEMVSVCSVFKGTHTARSIEPCGAAALALTRAGRLWRPSRRPLPIAHAGERRRAVVVSRSAAGRPINRSSRLSQCLDWWLPRHARGARDSFLASADSLLAVRGFLFAVRVRPDVRTLHDGPAPEVMESSGHRAPAFRHTVGLWCNILPLPVFRYCARVGHRGSRAACDRISNPHRTRRLQV
jgi:hypothetical protein